MSINPKIWSSISPDAAFILGLSGGSPFAFCTSFPDDQTCIQRRDRSVKSRACDNRDSFCSESDWQEWHSQDYWRYVYGARQVRFPVEIHQISRLMAVGPL